MPGHGLDFVGQLAPGSLEPADLFAEALLGFGGDLCRLHLGLLGHESCLRVGFGEKRGCLCLRIGSRLVDELLGEQERSLQPVVHDRCLGSFRRRLGLVLRFRLELGDPLGCLAQPLTALA